MSERDPELERLMQRRLQELARPIEPAHVEARSIVIDRRNFTSTVTGPLPVLVDFWADWCAPCRFMHPVFEKLAAKYAGKILFGRLDVDENGEIAARYQVFSIPTFMLFIGGRAVETVIGAVGENGLERVLSKYVGPAA